jgi:hypothetical protein
MEKVFLKENLKSYMQILLPDGFMLNNPADNEDFVFTKACPGLKFMISVDGEQDFPFDAHFMGAARLEVRINEVEELFEYAYLNTKNSPYKAFKDDSTFQFVFKPDGGDVDFKRIINQAVEDNETFELVRPLLQQAIKKATDFIVGKTTLASYFNIVDPMPIEEQADIVTQPLPARYLIFKKLLGYSDYSAYASELLSHYTGTTKATFIQNLKAKLDSL